MSDSHRLWSGTARLVPFALIVPLAGCFGHLTPAGASMAGLSAPVLLGPVDHVGGGKPLATTKIKDFEATAKHSFTNSQSDGYSTTVEISESSLSAEAEYATRNDKYADIRLTEVKPQAVGFISGVKSRVDVEGDVIRVKPVKGSVK